MLGRRIVGVDQERDIFVTIEAIAIIHQRKTPVRRAKTHRGRNEIAGHSLVSIAGYEEKPS